MANRVTHEEVLEIIDTDIEDTTPFITIANLLVTAKLSGESLEDAHLKEIERWLAAHFVAIRDPRALSEGIGDARVTYTFESGKGLEATPYGQQVLTLDTTGKMKQLGKTPVSMTAMGIDDD